MACPAREGAYGAPGRRGGRSGHAHASRARLGRGGGTRAPARREYAAETGGAHDRQPPALGGTCLGLIPGDGVRPAKAEQPCLASTYDARSATQFLSGMKACRQREHPTPARRTCAWALRGQSLRASREYDARSAPGWKLRAAPCGGHRTVRARTWRAPIPGHCVGVAGLVSGVAGRCRLHRGHPGSNYHAPPHLCWWGEAWNMRAQFTVKGTLLESVPRGVPT
jgi:hypothetical protein